MWTGAWPSLEIQRHRTSLAELASTVRDRKPEVADEVEAALARFLVVRTCGYVEQVSEECCRTYIACKSAPAITSFAQSFLGRGTNPTPEALEKLVRRFNGEWAEQLDAFFDQDDGFLRRELSFLVNRRNRIAHGLSEAVGVRKALDLVEVGERVGNWFVVTFDPT